MAKKDEVRKNRSFAKIEEDYYKNFEEKRARDLARVLKNQKIVTINNPEYEGIISELNERHSNSRITTQPNDLADQSHYADYLKHEI